METKCALCQSTLGREWVKCNGALVHPSCWAKTGLAPDIIAGIGEYAR